jgi:hypothetical protein
MSTVTISRFRHDALVALAITGWAGFLFLLGFILGAFL